MKPLYLGLAVAGGLGALWLFWPRAQATVEEGQRQNEGDTAPPRTASGSKLTYIALGNAQKSKLLSRVHAQTTQDAPRTKAMPATEEKPLSGKIGISVSAEQVMKAMPARPWGA